MRCSDRDVIELSVKPRRHVGGIFRYTYTSTCTREQFASVCKFAASHCCNIVGCFIPPTWSHCQSPMYSALFAKTDCASIKNQLSKITIVYRATHRFQRKTTYRIVHFLWLMFSQVVQKHRQGDFENFTCV